MPFAGASPKLTSRIDRCVNEVMERGHSKSSAIAICRSSIERKKKAYTAPHLKALKANFGARRGERIAGRLFRGEGGQFTSGGNGGEDKPISRRDRIALTQLQNGVRLKPARMAELQKAGFVTSAGKLTPKGLKAIGKKKPTATAGSKKKPKKGGGGGGKGDKKRQAVQKQVDTLNDAEKRLFRLFASGDLDKLPASLATKLERLGFVSKAGKMTATGRIAFDILGKDKKKAIALKRSRSPAEQRAMFAKMGATGGGGKGGGAGGSSLFAKNSEGKRVSQAGFAKPKSKPRPFRSTREINADIKSEISQAKRDIEILTEARNFGRGVVGVSDRIASTISRLKKMRQEVADRSPSAAKLLDKRIRGLQREFVRQNSRTGREASSKAHTTKSKQDAIDKANYRFIGEKSTQICTTCRFNNAGTCTLFDFRFDRDHICDRWRPNIKALRERARVLRGEEQRRQVPVTKSLTVKEARKLGYKNAHDLAIALKRSRSRAEQRAMFAKMRATGGGGKGGGAGGKRVAGAGNVGTGASKLDNEINSFLDGLNTGGNNVEDSILPKGKAPRGEGQEFATRRWIHSRMETMKSRRDRLEGIVGRNRGTRRGRREATAAQIKLDALNESIKMARHMITNLQNAGIPFADGRDIFSDIFSYTTATTGGVR